MITTKTSTRIRDPGKFPHVQPRDWQVIAHKLRVTFCTKQKNRAAQTVDAKTRVNGKYTYQSFRKPCCLHLRDATSRKGSSKTSPKRDLARSYEMFVTAYQTRRCHIPQNLNRHTNVEIPVTVGDSVVEASQKATLSFFLRCY